MSKKEIKKEEVELSSYKDEVRNSETRIRALINGQKRVIKEQRKQIKTLIDNGPKLFYFWLVKKLRREAKKI